MLLPLKFRILTELATNETRCATQVIDALTLDYGKERQFSKRMIEYHLQSLRAVGIVEDNDEIFDENDELVRFYTITDTGRNLLKYLPKDWQARVKQAG